VLSDLRLEKFVFKKNLLFNQTIKQE